MIDLVLSELGRRVRALRGQQGLTLQDLAARSGLSARFLVQVESGEGNISVRRLAGLAHALGTTAAALLSGPEEKHPPTIALLGLRGAGKTTIGRRLARRLHLPFVELDRRIEQAAGLTLQEVFALHGETYYRRLERETLERVLDEGPVVLATGGGLPTSPETWSLLKRRARTVWLRAKPEDHWNRVVQQGDKRPMADNPQAMAELRRLLATREPLYAQAATVVDTTKGAVDDLVAAIAGAAAGRNPPGRPRSKSPRSRVTDRTQTPLQSEVFRQARRKITRDRR